MLGILLVFISSALTEFADSVGKKEVKERVASVASFAFLNLLVGTSILLVIGFVKDHFIFSLDSLPTFLPRLALEILQAHLTVLAVVRADRSDFGLLKTFTIPLLFIVDVLIGYQISYNQGLGVTVIFLGILLLLSKEHFKTKGFWLVMLSAVNAVITLSLFKYNISNFNSVESEQIIIMLVQMLYFFILAKISYKENPFKLLRRPIFIAQTTTAGLAGTIASYAYLFAPAAIITGALRATAILTSIISGRFYFGEKNMTIKIISFVLVGVGLFLLI